MIEKFLGPDGMAVLQLADRVLGTRVVTAIAHAFTTPDGFAYVAPGYFFPHAAGANFLHHIVGELTDAGEFTGPEWTGKVEPYEPTAAQIAQTDYALEEFRQAVAAEGKTIAGERDRLRDLVLEDVKTRA